MSEMSNEAVQAQIESRGLKEGNRIKDPTGAVDGTNASVPLYIDSLSTLQAGNFPFAVPLFAGVTNTANSVVSIEGQSTGTANDLMHLTLVSGANATATIAGYYRVTVTDDAGNIATGAYYAPFYTLA